MGVTITGITTTRRINGKSDPCPKCNQPNLLKGDGEERICERPGCDAVISSVQVTVNDVWKERFSVEWQWCPKMMRCVMCHTVLGIRLSEHGVLVYVCMNKNCSCCEE